MGCQNSVSVITPSQKELQKNQTDKSKNASFSFSSTQDQSCNYKKLDQEIQNIDPEENPETLGQQAQTTTNQNINTLSLDDILVQEKIFGQFDQRKEIQNNRAHPFNGVGRIIYTLKGLKVNKPGQATGFLITTKHILTNAHLFKWQNPNQYFQPQRFQFFPEPLSIDQQYKEGTGIQAKIVHIDHRYFSAKTHQESRFHDCVVLELSENSKIKPQMVLKCNFQYSHKTNNPTQDVICIPSYPSDFQINSLTYSNQGPFTKALFYTQMPAQSQKPIGIFNYMNPTTPGTSGAPLLLKKPDGSYEVVGLHIGADSKSNYGILFKSCSLKQTIQNLIKVNTSPSSNAFAQRLSSPPGIPKKSSPPGLQKKPSPPPGIQNKASPPHSGIQKKPLPPGIQKKLSPPPGIPKKSSPPGIQKKPSPPPGISKKLIPSHGISKKSSPLHGIPKKSSPSPGLQKKQIPPPGIPNKAIPASPGIPKKSIPPGLHKKQIPYPGIQKKISISLGISKKTSLSPGISLKPSLPSGYTKKIILPSGSTKIITFPSGGNTKQLPPPHILQKQLPLPPGISKKIQPPQILDELLQQYSENNQLKIKIEDDVYVQTFAFQGDKFKNLQTINLSNSKITDYAVIALAQNGHKFKSLQTIYLYRNQITDNGFTVLAQNGDKFQSLKTIKLGYNKITDAGFTALAQNGGKFKNLETIDVYKNQITDAGLIALAQNGEKFNNLQGIYLSYNKIADAGLIALALNGEKFKSLQIIYLSNNIITDTGLTVLAQNGDKLKNLQTISLWNNKISDYGLIMLVQNGPQFKSLQEIYLSSNKITDAGLQSIANLRKNLKFKIHT